MMFSKALVVSALAVFAAASPTHGGKSVSQCNTGGGAQCCNSVGKASSLPGVSVLTGLLGIVLPDVNAVVGLTCAPIIGSVSCNQQTVCCTQNNFNGLINIGCSPISL